MTKMNAVFLPTVDLSDRGIQAALAARTLVLRPGQWVTDGRGNRGQYITTRKGVTYVAWAGKGERFTERTQRFCRANWHQNHKATDPVRAVTHAPASLSFMEVREWFASHFAGRSKRLAA